MRECTERTRISIATVLRALHDQPAVSGAGVHFFNIDSGAELMALIGEAVVGHFGGFYSLSVDKVLTSYASSSNGASNSSASSALATLMVKEAPIIPLFYNMHQGEYRTAHFTGLPTSTDPYALPTPQGANTESVVLHLKPS